MGVEPAGGARLIQNSKLELIEALYGDPDFLLQHCHSIHLLTQKEYDHVKATAVPWDKARDILDYIMIKDRKHVQTFLKLLKKKEIQEAFPKLEFLNDMLLRQSITTEKKRKTITETRSEEGVPRKKPCKGSRLVTERQLMLVARHIGTNWKEVGRVALEIPSINLDHILVENPNSHRERVFCMLRLWSIRKRDKASTTHLHSLLTQEEFCLTPGSIDFLLEES